MAAFLGFLVGATLDPFAWFFAYLIYRFTTNRSLYAFFALTVVLLTFVRAAMAPTYEGLPANSLFDGLAYLLSSVIMAGTFAYVRYLRSRKEVAPDSVADTSGSAIVSEESLFDRWIDFYGKNENWLSNEIVFRLERLPFAKATLLAAFSEEIDSFRRNGMLQLSLDSLLVHLNIIMRFQDVPDDFPLLTHRLLILNSASTNSDDQVKFIADNPALLDSLEVSDVERKLVQKILDEAIAFCEQNRLPLDRFKTVNMSTYASLGT